MSRRPRLAVQCGGDPGTGSVGVPVWGIGLKGSVVSRIGPLSGVWGSSRAQKGLGGNVQGLSACSALSPSYFGGKRI